MPSCSRHDWHDLIPSFRCWYFRPFQFTQCAQWLSGTKLEDFFVRFWVISFNFPHWQDSFHQFCLWFFRNKYCRLSTSGFKAFSGPCVLGEYSCTRFLTIMESARYAACNEDEQVRPSGRSWIYRRHLNLHQTFKRCWNSPRNDHLYSAKSIVLDNMYYIH